MCNLLKKLEMIESMTKEWEYQSDQMNLKKNQTEPLLLLPLLLSRFSRVRLCATP